METIPGVNARSWNDITIADFFILKNIEDNKALSLIQKRIKTLSALSGIPEVQVEKLRGEIISSYFEKELSFLNTEVNHDDLKEYYVINGKKYRLIKQIDQLTGGQFIDLQEYTKDSDHVLDSLHLILTVFLMPVRELTPRQVLKNKIHRIIPERVSRAINWKYFEGIPENYMETPCAITCEELYQHMKITDAMSITLFFCVLGDLFFLTTNLYLEMITSKQLASVSKILETEKIPDNLREKAQSQISLLLDGHGS